MTLQLLHLADLHFGGLADIRQIEALEGMLPDLRPDATVITGDLSQRARHGELQRARAFANLGALSSHGLAWGSLTTTVRDLAVKGHLAKREMERVRQVFADASPDVARVLVVHHNVLRGAISQRMGLSRWRTAQQRIIASGADVVLCGHDHQEAADILGGRVVVSTTGTLCTRSRGGRPSCFNFVTIEPTAVQVTFFRWEAERGKFRPSDTFAFARPQAAERGDAVQVAAH